MTDETSETFAELIAGLARMPELVAKLVSDLPAQAVRTKPSPDEFSALENICHLRDIEIEGYSTRIKRILAEDQPKLPDINGARLAIERDYNNQEVSEAMASLTLARQQNVSVLRQLDKDQFERTGDLAGVGRVTIGKLLLMMREHDDDHVEELQRIRNSSR
jgi:hypothetical protein